MRRYKTGSRWALWRWSVVRHPYPDGEPYLTRLHLVKTPWFSVMLHWIHRPDPQPDPHDHPVSFLSLVLRGGYEEFRYEEWRGTSYISCWRKIRWWNFLRATDVHRIIRVQPGTLTLALAGPVVRRWGFHLRDGSWVDWTEYTS